MIYLLIIIADDKPQCITQCKLFLITCAIIIKIQLHFFHRFVVISSHVMSCTLTCVKQSLLTKISLFFIIMKEFYNNIVVIDLL